MNYSHNCPCKGCLPPTRSSTCHPSCEKYLEWKKNIDEINEAAKKERDIARCISKMGYEAALNPNRPKSLIHRGVNNGHR